MGQILNWASILDFSDEAGVKKAIKWLNEILKAYTKIIDTTTKGKAQIVAANKAIADSVKTVVTETNKLSEANKDDAVLIQKRNAELKALTVTSKAQQKQIAALEKQLKKLTTERKAVAKGVKEVNNLNTETIKLEKQLIKLTGQDAKNQAALKLQIQEKRKALSEEAKVAAGRVTLYQKESARLNDLRNKYKNVALAQGQNSKAAKGLLKQITPLDKKLKSLDGSVGQNQRSVGAYGDAISNTVPAVGALKNQVLTLFRVIASNPIGLIVVALVSLIAAFGKTQKGADAFNKIFEQISATVDVVIGRVAQLADGIVGLFKGEEGALDKVKNSFDDIGKEIEGAVEDAGKLVDTQIRLRQINIQITEETAKRSRQIQDLIIITRDLTKSFAEQRRALVEANKLELANQADQVRLAKEKLLLAEQEFQFTPVALRNDEQRLKVAEARAEVQRVIGASTAKQRELLNRQNELETRINAIIKRRKDLAVKGLTEIGELEERSGIKRIAIDDEVTKALIANSKLIGAQTQKRVDEQVAAAAKKKLIIETSFEATSLIGNAIFENGKINRDNELTDLQAQKEFELALAGDNAQQKAAIEARFAAKEKKLKIEAAKAEKKQALFNIAISTAISIAKSAQAGFPAAIPFIIASAALGVIQAAAVASQPLPAFEHGGTVETDGNIQVTEKGREMFVGKDGKLGMLQGNTAQVVSGMKGAEILSNPVTESILANNFDHKAINDDSSHKIQRALQQEKDRHTNMMIVENRKENDLIMRSFDKAMGKMEVHKHHYRRGQMVTDMKKGATTQRDWDEKNAW